MTLHYSAPGKLFISGEWSILEMGTKGLVAAVNSRVHVKISGAHDGIAVSADDFNIRGAKARYENGKLLFENIDEKAKETLKLVSESIAISLRYLEEKYIQFRPFGIETNSKDLQIMMHGQPKKVGFGSSAAVVVATIAAILNYFDYKASKEELYKLATIAHYYAQGKVGSAFDVAASSYGGLFVYSRFDPDWLTKKMESGEKVSKIIEEKWPGFHVEQLAIPNDFRLLIGWTKQEASTSPLVKQMNEYKKNNVEEYSDLIKNVAECADRAIDAWKRGDHERFFKCLQQNRQALAELGEKSGVNIETPDLQLLAHIAEKHGVAGKLSGAGGGDCGIAVCFDHDTEERITSEWKKTGIFPLETTIDRDGVRKE